LDQNVSMIIMMVVMLAVFYFMLIRPENKRKKEAEKMRSELAVGDVITSIGGITGTICAVKETTIVIETGADRVRIELTKWAVSSKGTQAVENVK
jgi:preprotein translocase subunit YajC